MDTENITEIHLLHYRYMPFIVRCHQRLSSAVEDRRIGWTPTFPTTSHIKTSMWYFRIFKNIFSVSVNVFYAQIKNAHKIANENPPNVTINLLKSFLLSRFAQWRAPWRGVHEENDGGDEDWRKLVPVFSVSGILICFHLILWDDLPNKGLNFICLFVILFWL